MQANELNPGARTDPRQPLAEVKIRELENSRLVILENEINQLKRTTAITSSGGWTKSFQICLKSETV